jgi:hypothetical protein
MVPYFDLASFGGSRLLGLVLQVAQMCDAWGVGYCVFPGNVKCFILLTASSTNTKYTTSSSQSIHHTKKVTKT